MDYVLYHSNCYDGFGAAYSAWKKLGDRAEYIPVSYGKDLPELNEPDIVYIVDFSYPKDVILDLSKRCQVVVLDHHKTAEEDLESLVGLENPKVKFDMDKSGALLTWEWFHGDKNVPDLIKHISDRDLWEFKLEGTKEIHKALVSHPMNFELWDGFDVEELKSEGKICQRLYDNLVENIIKESFFRVVGGHEVPVVNTSIAWSEVGHALIKRYPEAPFVASFTVFDKEEMWSLRSKGNFDVSEIAKVYGGGGHKNAAGFKKPKIALS